MVAEHSRKTEKIRTDIHADRPGSARKATKKPKKLKATLSSKTSDSEEEETSEKPSMSSSKGTSKNDSSLNTTPRSKNNVNAGIDHHVKYSENQKLKKWLKEKDKIYRQKIKEERKKKREEREKLINEANSKIESRIKSQKLVKQWMKEKNKEFTQKYKEEMKREKEILEHEQIRQSNGVPGDALKIRPQSAPYRSDDIHIDINSVKGGDTSGHVRDQIHMKKEIDEENRQAKIAFAGAPHPPQTKFIYKRPVAGKIKLKMQVRGKSPVAQKKENNKTNGDKSEDEQDKDKSTRISYDDWVKKKREDDVDKKKNAERQKQMAKSDPELERIIPALGKKRIEDKLNSRKRIDTGIKKFDDKVNKSFGGSEFDGEQASPERPKSAYRLESDKKNGGESALSVSSKPLQRPSTAPPRGRAAPSPKKSVESPRKAIIPQKVDKVMSNNDVSNPYTLPFSGEKGVPVHVADRQRRIFADIVTTNLNEIEQRALLNAELIKQGVSDEDIEKYRQEMEADMAKYNNKYKTKEAEAITDNEETQAVEEDPHPKITDIMYSPRRQEYSSDSSSDENVSAEKNSDLKNDTVDKSAENKADETKLEARDLNDEIVKDNVTDEEKSNESSKAVEDTSSKPASDTTKNNTNDSAGVNNHSHYKTYDNLNELKIEAKSTTGMNETNNAQVNDDDSPHDDDLRFEYEEDFVHSQDEMSVTEDEQDKKVETKEVTIVSDPDPNVVGILKERKEGEEYPSPEASEEPMLREKRDEEELAASNGDLAGSRKRVSFNAKTEIFQSFESSSTDTVTPHGEEFDAKAESLDAHDDTHDFFSDRSTSREISGLFHGSCNTEDSRDLGFDDDESESKMDTFITNPENEPDQW